MSVRSLEQQKCDTINSVLITPILSHLLIDLKFRIKLLYLENDEFLLTDILSHLFIYSKFHITPFYLQMITPNYYFRS